MGTFTTRMNWRYSLATNVRKLRQKAEFEQAETFLSHPLLPFWNSVEECILIPLFSVRKQKNAVLQLRTGWLENVQVIGAHAKRRHLGFKQHLSQKPYSQERICKDTCCDYDTDVTALQEPRVVLSMNSNCRIVINLTAIKCKSSSLVLQHKRYIYHKEQEVLIFNKRAAPPPSVMIHQR